MEFEFIPFPALRAKRTVVRAQAVGAGEEAACFFHAENQAATICDGCGRFLCAVCSIDLTGRPLCPSCIAAQKDKTAHTVNDRMLYDGLAMTLALVPLIMWPLTVVTAPVALGVVIYGWRKPGSLVRGKRWRLVAAGVIAFVEIAAWCGFVIMLFLE